MYPKTQKLNSSLSPLYSGQSISIFLLSFLLNFSRYLSISIKHTDLKPILRQIIRPPFIKPNLNLSKSINRLDLVFSQNYFSICPLRQSKLVNSSNFNIFIKDKPDFHSYSFLLSKSVLDFNFLFIKFQHSLKIIIFISYSTKFIELAIYFISIKELHSN